MVFLICLSIYFSVKQNQICHFLLYCKTVHVVSLTHSYHITYHIQSNCSPYTQRFLTVLHYISFTAAQTWTFIFLLSHHQSTVSYSSTTTFLAPYLSISSNPHSSIFPFSYYYSPYWNNFKCWQLFVNLINIKFHLHLFK